jgi:hypothetical protein
MRSLRKGFNKSLDLEVFSAVIDVGVLWSESENYTEPEVYIKN